MASNNDEMPLPPNVKLRKAGGAVRDDKTQYPPNVRVRDNGQSGYPPHVREVTPRKRGSTITTVTPRAATVPAGGNVKPSNRSALKPGSPNPPADELLMHEQGNDGPTKESSIPSTGALDALTSSDNGGEGESL